MMSFPGVLTLQPGPFSILVHPSLLKDSPLGVQQPPAVSLQLWGQSPSPCHLPQGEEGIGSGDTQQLHWGRGVVFTLLSPFRLENSQHESIIPMKGWREALMSTHPWKITENNENQKWRFAESMSLKSWTWSFADSPRNSLSPVARPTV